MAKKKTRRAPGAGHLFVRTSKAGVDSWYAKLYLDGRQVKRKIGEKRAPGGSRGLTRAEAEKALRRLAEETQRPVSERVTVQSAGERLVADNSSGLSTKSVLNYVSVLHSLFEFGIRRGWASVNPVKKIEKPERPEPNGDIRFLDDADLEALLAAERDDALGPTLRALYLTAAMTGLRQGELLGLRWLDVDWIAARVRVRRNWVRGECTGRPRAGVLLGRFH